MRPDPADPSCPAAAAVCVYPSMVATAAAALAAPASTSPRSPPRSRPGSAALDVKLADTRAAVAAGADEIDMVINRGAFLSGRYLEVFDEIVAVRRPAATPTSRSSWRPASWPPTTTCAGPPGWRCWPARDFIKTSTGKVAPAATLPVTLVMLEAVRDYREATGRQVGVKPAGGIRTTKDAIKYLVMVNEIAGEDWLDPDWFRFGASTPAQRPAHAAHQAAHRPLLRPRLLHAGLIACD